MAEKSPDAFRTISEVAEEVRVPAHVLRFWESRFTQIKPVKRAGGRRYYRPEDVELIAGIKRLLHDHGMTIRGVQKLLKDHGTAHIATMAESGALPPALPGVAPFAPPPALGALPVPGVVLPSTTPRGTEVRSFQTEQGRPGIVFSADPLTRHAPQGGSDARPHGAPLSLGEPAPLGGGSLSHDAHEVAARAEPLPPPAPKPAAEASPAHPDGKAPAPFNAKTEAPAAESPAPLEPPVLAEPPTAPEPEAPSRPRLSLSEGTVTIPPRPVSPAAMLALLHHLPEGGISPQAEGLRPLVARLIALRDRLSVDPVI